MIEQWRCYIRYRIIFNMEHHLPAPTHMCVNIKYVFLVIDVTQRTFGPIFHRNGHGSYEICQAELHLKPGESMLQAWNDHVRPYVDPRMQDYSFVFYTKVADVYVVLVSQPLAQPPSDMVYLNHTWSYTDGVDAAGPIKLRRFTDAAFQLWHVLLRMVPRFMMQTPRYGIMYDW